MTTSLPTPRSLITSLFGSLSSAPTTQSNATAATNPTQTQQTAMNSPYDQPCNTLKALPASHRALLTTLHVLLPTGVLLQALDLLDRGLVVRVIEKTPAPDSSGHEKDGDEGRVMLPQAHLHLSSSSISAQLHPPQIQPLDPANAQESTPGHAIQGKSQLYEEKIRNGIYLVRSSQAPKSRFRDPLSSSTASNLTYTVRLEAWNCSCAAFAFESYPGGSGAGNRAPWSRFDEESDQEDGDEGVEWEFGGLSFDGRAAKDGGNGGEGQAGKVPVCKHLLACLLVERWEDVLGRYVKEMEVGREEMAGFGGEG